MADMTATPPPTLASCVRLHDPGEVVAAVPHLLGFHPGESLVVLCLTGERRSRVGLCLRLDLPPEEDETAVLDHVLPPLRGQRASGVLLVVVGGGARGPRGGPPRRSLVAAVERAVAESGVACLHSVWVAATSADERWFCYDEEACSGRVPDPAATVTAAASALAGFVTFADRAALARLLDPDPPADLHRRAELLGLAAETADLERALDTGRAARADLAAVHRALEQVERGTFRVEDEDVARIAVALSETRVRDACMSWSSGPRSAAAERMWLLLTRATPPPHRAEPAALLAVTAYLRGDGALAGLALEVTRAAVPEHGLARLLGRALAAGLPPDRVERVVADGAEEARLAIESDGEDTW